MRRLGSLLAFLALLGAPLAADAQMFRWTDEQGRVHYSEGIDSVPQKYRATARPLLLPTPPAAPSGGPQGAQASSGATKIPFKPGSPILVNARINGGGPVTLLLDTGADATVVSPLALWKLGISTWFAERTEIRGVTGSQRADIVRIQSLEVGEAKAGPLVIIAHDVDGLKDADGLLGRDFLNHFNVSIDPQAGVVTLAPR